MRFFPPAAIASLSICILATIAGAQQSTQTHDGQVGSDSNSGQMPTMGILGLGPVDQVFAAGNPVEPKWLPEINEKHRQFIEQLLDYWQKSSDDVNRYQCEFSRYDYDTSICNWRDAKKNNQLAAASIMTGEIRFANPDKACYETNAVYDFALDELQQIPDYKQRTDPNNREKWICDGSSIFEFDFANRRLYETTIPDEMRGKGLVNSPIPFLFGASKDDIQNRFWVRIVTPDQVQDEYWLEAVPKRIDDVQNYSKVELVISRTDFLPVMLHIYAPNYDPVKNNFTSRVFEFRNRKANGALATIQDFFNRFVRPATPVGWELVARKGLTQPRQFDRPNIDNSAQLPSPTPVR